MKKITLTKDNKVIQVNEFAAKLLKKSGWSESTTTPEIIKEKAIPIQVPPEVKELTVLKKEVVAVKEEKVDVIAEKKTANLKPAVKKNPNLKPAVKKQ
jgi:hypothetical protein